MCVYMFVYISPHNQGICLYTHLHIIHIITLYVYMCVHIRISYLLPIVRERERRLREQHVHEIQEREISVAREREMRQRELQAHMEREHELQEKEQRLLQEQQRIQKEKQLYEEQQRRLR